MDFCARNTSDALIKAIHKVYKRIIKCQNNKRLKTSYDRPEKNNNKEIIFCNSRKLLI